jgi:hypothetical protein
MQSSMLVNTNKAQDNAFRFVSAAYAYFFYFFYFYWGHK